MTQRELGLSDVIGVLRRHGLWMLIASLLFGVAAYGLTFLLPPVYRSQALLVVNVSGPELPLSELDMETWRDVLLARNTVERVLSKLGWSDKTIESAQKRMQARLTKRITRDAPYAKNLNLTFDALNPAESQQFLHGWCATAEKISDEMAAAQIARLKSHYRSSYDAAKGEATTAEDLLTKFRSTNRLPEEKQRLKVLQDSMETQRKDYQTAMGEVRLKEAGLATLQNAFQSYFTGGRWVGDLAPGAPARAKTPSKYSGVTQMSAARSEYLGVSKDLEKVKVQRNAGPLAEELRAVTEMAAETAKQLAQEKAQAESLKEAVAKLEKERAATGLRPVVQLRKSPSDDAFFLGSPDEKRSYLKGKGMVGEELNPQYFEVETMLAQDRDAMNKALAKTRALGETLKRLVREQEVLNKTVAQAEQEKTALELQMEGAATRYRDAQGVFNQVARDIATLDQDLYLARIRRDTNKRNVEDLGKEVREVQRFVAENEQTERDLSVRFDKSQDVLAAHTQKFFFYSSLNDKNLGLLRVASPASLPKAKVWPPRRKIALGAALLALFTVSLVNLLRESIEKEKRAA